MFARKFRFHGHGSLRGVYQKGKALYGPHVKLLYMPSTKLRVAVVVSKKVHKSAVVRNRIRRRVYSVIQNYYTERTMQFVSMVCVVQAEQLATAPAEEVRLEIVQLLQKIKNVS